MKIALIAVALLSSVSFATEVSIPARQWATENGGSFTASVIDIKALEVPFAGSIALWFAGVILYLFFATALGIYLGTVSRTMAQFALLIILVIVVLQMLSGGGTPVESQPIWLQYITFLLPSRHFVSFSQIIVYRGGGFSAVWSQFTMVAIIGIGFFVYSLSLFRKSVSVSK